ncbi:MAG: dihydroxy-acid dehydratase [Rubrobacteraceae bacterium]
MTRIGVCTANHADRVRDAGSEPVEIGLPEVCPAGGVMLTREWISDTVEVYLGSAELDALLIDAGRPEELVGLFLAALRLDLPSVVARRSDAYGGAFTALGVVPAREDVAEVIVELSAKGEPRLGELVGNFSLANALRVGLSMGGGPELAVHLSAIAREGDVSGFSRMLRVLVPETPVISPPHSGWFQEQGTEKLLSHLGEDLHDVPTVTGWIKNSLPSAPPIPEERSWLVFVEGQASGTKAICQVPPGTEEIAGECRVFYSEEEAVQAVRDEEIEPGDLIVVSGCGPRGGPGLLKLDALGRVLDGAKLAESTPVLTDGLPPDEAKGSWISLVAPEAAKKGIVGRLRDGDFLRMDLQEERIRAGTKPAEIRSRDPYEIPNDSTAGYAARYARSALPALAGAGFG